MRIMSQNASSNKNGVQHSHELLQVQPARVEAVEDIPTHLDLSTNVANVFVATAVTNSVLKRQAAMIPALPNGSVKSIPDPNEMTEFAVNFVVEQTGYPPDMVDLDADLEADLGIDSITLAQMLGEIRNRFGITPSSDSSLSDFATLKDVVRIFIESATSQSDPSLEIDP